mmetsp:Transcript_23180/g.46914  ORF Transcript_23180/g.46914 Transcript_23180/m.46914 type:complete len:152 (+) Transcript_23180:97-552(+)
MGHQATILHSKLARSSKSSPDREALLRNMVFWGWAVDSKSPRNVKEDFSVPDWFHAYSIFVLLPCILLKFGLQVFLPAALLLAASYAYKQAKTGAWASGQVALRKVEEALRKGGEGSKEEKRDESKRKGGERQEESNGRTAGGITEGDGER